MHIIKSIAEFFGLRTDTAEITSSQDAAMASLACRSLAYYIAASYISNALSKCEFKTYVDGKPVKNELYYALNVSPNPNQNGSAFINALVEKCLYNGESLMVQPTKALNRFYIADSFSEDPCPLRENVFSSVVVEGLSLRKTFRASDACHFKLESRSIRGLVFGMYQDFGELLSMAMASYKNANGEKFTFRKSGNPGGTRAEVKEASDEVNDLLKNFMRNPNGVMPLWNQQELTRLTPNPNSGSSKDVIDLRKDIFEITASAFKIPQSMMYGNMTNTNDVINQFITFGVDPWAQMISDELTRGFYDFSAWGGGKNYIKVDTSKINHTDIFQIADKAEKLVSSGLFSIDGVLDAMGADMINEDYSQAHWITKNYELIQDALARLTSESTEGGDN